MKYFIKSGLLVLPLFFAFGFNLEPKEISHKIQIVHPGLNEGEPVESVLVERQNEKGETLEFFINVESVICTENKCKVVPVDIFWDRFGRYQRIELQKGTYLEKYEGEKFSRKDYRQLDKVLKNKNSVLANYKIEKITGAPDTIQNKESLEDVDGITGATIISIDNTETIKGATLTCYTLWHWVNGGVSQIIREISLKEMDNIKLVEPDFNEQVTLYEALKERKSTRSFSSKDISDQDLSNLLWAAAGINRNNGGRTVPLLGDIAVYVAMKSGVYLYRPEDHEIELVLKEDIRSKISYQDPVKKAPLVFIMTIDDNSYADYMKEAMKEAHGMDFYYGNQVAYSTQNIYLYACSNDMNAVVMGGFYRDKVDELLGLGADHHSYLIQLVGYKKE